MTAAPTIRAEPGVVPMPADDPTDLSKPEWRAILKSTVREMSLDDVPGLAAGVAFKIFLSLFPSLLAATAIYGLIRSPAEIAAALEELDAFLPSSLVMLLDEALSNITGTEEGAAGGLAIAGVLGGLVSATGAAASLIKALNKAFDLPETRNLIGVRLVALVVTLALFAALGSLVALLVFGPQLRDALIPADLQVTGVRFVFAIGQVLVALIVLAVLFAFIFWVAPNRPKPQWEWASPGAIVAVVGWLVISAGFTLYTQTLGNYNATYGSIAGVIVVLLWLQLSMLAILLGAELNAEIEKARSVRLAGRDAVLHGGGATSHTVSAALPGLAPTPLVAGALHAAAERTEPLPEAAPEDPLYGEEGAGARAAARDRGRDREDAAHDAGPGSKGGRDQTPAVRSTAAPRPDYSAARAAARGAGLPAPPATVGPTPLDPTVVKGAAAGLVALAALAWRRVTGPRG